MQDQDYLKDIWVLKQRKIKPIIQDAPQKRIKILDTLDCPFCQRNFLFACPEKSALFVDGNSYFIQDRRNITLQKKDIPLFKRIGNLFEMVSYSYWKEKYPLKDQKEDLNWIKQYLLDPDAKKQIDFLIERKAQESTLSQKDILPSLFLGYHDLIIATKHFVDGAKYQDDLFYSGSLSQKEHFYFFKLALHAMKNMYKKNPYITYISVFQNYLSKAGASLEHLHKQIIGVDRFPAFYSKLEKKSFLNPSFFNDLIQISGKEGLILAQNKHAILVIHRKSRYPIFVIYSKSSNLDPLDHTDEELKDISNLVHLVHHVLGPYTPANEEWFYQPKSAKFYQPFRIQIEVRSFIAAGFEKTMGIFVNPMKLENIKKDWENAFKTKDPSLLNGMDFDLHLSFKEKILQYEFQK